MIDVMDILDVVVIWNTSDLTKPANKAKAKVRLGDRVVVDGKLYVAGRPDPWNSSICFECDVHGHCNNRNRASKPFWCVYPLKGSK